MPRHRQGVFTGQTFGFGIDLVWANILGNERHTVWPTSPALALAPDSSSLTWRCVQGLVNSICGFHAKRQPGHKSGRDDSSNVRYSTAKFRASGATLILGILGGWFQKRSPALLI